MLEEIKEFISPIVSSYKAMVLKQNRILTDKKSKSNKIELINFFAIEISSEIFSNQEIQPSRSLRNCGSETSKNL